MNGKTVERGSVLIEALISILIFSIGVLGMVGLQARMVQESIHAQYRIDASYLASKAVSETTVGTFVEATWVAEIQTTLPNGNGTVTVANNQMRAVVSWRLPEEAETDRHNFTLVSQICTNPASATCN